MPRTAARLEYLRVGSPGQPEPGTGGNQERGRMGAQSSRWPQRLRRAARSGAAATALAVMIAAAGCASARPLGPAARSPVPGAGAGGAGP